MATAYEIQVTEAYIGLLGRAPDPAGLAYWVGQLGAAVAAGQDATLALKKLTNDIAKSPEYTAGTIGTQVPAEGNPSQTQADSIVSSLYLNLFERAATQADKDYWTPQLTGGSTSAPEMTLNLITAAKSNTAKPTDGEVLGYKQAAATYYVETVSQENFSRDSAKIAVDPVNGPSTLQESKTATDFVASGTGVTTDLADIGAGNDVTMTGGDDVITGTVGSGTPTYSTQNVIDSYTGDNDSLTLTGDAGFAFDNIDKVENVNVNLGDTTGAAFTLSTVNNVLNSTINIDVAEKVTVAGVELDGETDVILTGALTSNVNTTDVKSLIVTTGDSNVAIVGDNDLAAITANDIADDATSITLSAASSAVNLDGTAADNDAVSVSAVGAVALDVSQDTGQLIEKVTLSGNAAAATFTITGATGADMTYAVTGDQNVTLAGAGAQFTTASFTNTNTGTTAMKLATGSDGKLLSFGVLSGGVELSGDHNGRTYEVASGSTVKVSDAAQTGTVTLSTNDTATDSTLTLDLDNDVSAIVTDKVETLTIDAGSAARSLASVAGTGGAEQNVIIAGSNDVTFTATIDAKALTISGVEDVSVTGITTATSMDVTGSGSVAFADELAVANDIKITGDGVSLEEIDVAVGTVTLTATGNDIGVSAATDIDSGNLVATAADAISLAAVSVANDVTINGDDFKVTSTFETLEGDVSVTVTNDVDFNNTVGVDGKATISGISVDFDNTVDVDNDVVITATGNDVTADNTVVVNAGDLTITAANDINLDGAVTITAGDLKLTSTTRDIDTSAILIAASNDITMTAADTLVVGDLGTTKGNAVLTAGNDMKQDTAAMDINGNLTMTANGVGATVGLMNIDNGGVVDNDITLTADTIDLDATLTSNAGNIVMTATNDITIDTAASGATAGSITLTTTLGMAGTAGADIATSQTLTAQNDVTVKADDVTLAAVTATAQGDVLVEASNNVTLNGAITNNGGTTGDVTVTAAGTVSVTNVNVLAEDNITITSSGGKAVSLGNGNITSDTGNVVITGGTINGTNTITATTGTVTLNATNDTENSTMTTVTADASEGGITFSNGKWAIATGVNANVGGVTIGGDTSGSFAAVAAESDGVTITTSGNVSFTTIDAVAVNGVGTGDYTLGTVTSSGGAVVGITSGSGADSVTLNNEKYTVNMGDGIDTVAVTQTTAGSVVNGGGGDDTITLTRAASLGTFSGGAGTGDTIVLATTGDWTGDGQWTDIEKLSIAGNTTLSEAQLDNDGTFQVRTSNGVITVDGNTLDASGVTYLAGNTSSFALSGTTAADTLIGSGAGDTITIAATDDAVGETYTGGDGTDILDVNDTTTKLSDDTISGIETLQLDSGGTAVAIEMSDAQVDSLTTVIAAVTNITTGDIITLSDLMTADMLDGTAIGGAGVDDEAVFKLKNLGDHALTLANATLDGTDKLYIDASALTGANDVTFDGTAEVTATTVIEVAGGAGADTITGGAGADILDGNTGGDTITGKGGNDTITLGGTDTTADTIKIAFGGEGVDTVGEFEAGTDLLDLTGTTDVNDAAGGDLDVDGFLLIDGSAAHVIADGLTVVSGVVQAVDAGAQLTAAEIATFLADMTAGGAAQAMTVATAADVAYVIVEGQGGTSTLAKVTGGGDTAIGAADVTIILHFTGVEAEDLVAASFVDFA